MITRGVKHKVDHMIDQLQGKYMPFKFKGQECMFQMGVRPIQLWELGFPQESLQTIMASLWPSKKPFSGHAKPMKEQIAMAGLRKILQAKAMPKFDPNHKEFMALAKDDVNCYPIGIKEDGRLVGDNGEDQGEAL